MKKLSVIFLVLILVLTAFSLTGCEQAQVRVESVLNISTSPSFSGERTVTVAFPLSADIDAVKDEIVSSAPIDGVRGVTFEYIGVEETGYIFELKLAFSSKEEYISEVAAVIGRTPSIFLSEKNTVLTKGVRMTEDFSSENLVSWVSAIAEASSENNFVFNYDVNTVTVDGAGFSTASATDVDSREGSPLTSISIDTANSKEGRYDRTVTFTVPNDTYNASKSALEEYFLTNTAPDASYFGWTAKGSNTEYTVIFHDLDIEKLNAYTAMLLDTASVDVFYGDRDNASTPLSEGLTFEESLDTFSFIGEDGAVPLYYSYSLPTETTHGDGSVKTGGSWTTFGTWSDGVYSADFSADSLTVRIPDGIQYFINGINFTLESQGEGTFRKTVEFLYSTTDGYDGMNYAAAFFRALGADVNTFETDSDLVCSVCAEGTAAEITDAMVRLFGSGNFMTYTQSTGTFSLSTKTALTDYINMGYMLNSANANRPMTYTVRSLSDENIISLSVDSSEIQYSDSKSDSLTVGITAGAGSVSYRGNIPILSRIIVYIILSVLLVAVAAIVSILLLRKNKKKNATEKAPAPSSEERCPASPADAPAKESGEGPADSAPEDETDSSSSLSQTTTFSILELGILSRNKDVVDEINRDIEERLEAERLEDMKKEIRAEELAEMERKVYGSGDDAEPSKDGEDDA